jgi:hypothetical protein
MVSCLTARRLLQASFSATLKANNQVSISRSRWRAAWLARGSSQRAAITSSAEALGREGESGPPTPATAETA